jgi:hypothetical protein
LPGKHDTAFAVPASAGKLHGAERTRGTGRVLRWYSWPGWARDIRGPAVDGRSAL